MVERCLIDEFADLSCSECGGFLFFCLEGVGHP